MQSEIAIGYGDGFFTTNGISGIRSVIAIVEGDCGFSCRIAGNRFGCYLQFSGCRVILYLECHGVNGVIIGKSTRTGIYFPDFIGIGSSGRKRNVTKVEVALPIIGGSRFCWSWRIALRGYSKGELILG